MTVRTAQLRALGPVLVRVVRWQPVLVAAAASMTLLWWQDDRLAEQAGAVWLLRCVALLLAVASASALDDPTRPLLAAVPTPQWWRAALRMVVVVVPASLVWAAALLWVAARTGGRVPGAALTLEAAGLMALVLAVAGGLARWRGTDDPGLVAGPVVLGLGVLLPRLPGRLAMAGLPGPGWDAAHVRWSVLLVAAAVVLALSVRDPAQRVRRWDP